MVWFHCTSEQISSGAPVSKRVSFPCVSEQASLAIRRAKSSEQASVAVRQAKNSLCPSEQVSVVVRQVKGRPSEQASPVCTSDQTSEGYSLSVSANKASPTSDQTSEGVVSLYQRTRRVLYPPVIRRGVISLCQWTDKFCVHQRSGERLSECETINNDKNWV